MTETAVFGRITDNRQGMNTTSQCPSKNQRFYDGAVGDQQSVDALFLGDFG